MRNDIIELAHAVRNIANIQMVQGDIGESKLASEAPPTLDGC